MSLFYTVFGVMGFLALLAVVLGSIGFVLLSRVSSKIAQIELEVEKKTKEFDALRAGGLTSREDVHKTRVMEIGSDSPIMQVPGQKPDASETQIHIVRNVRGSYDQSELSRLEENVMEMGNNHSHGPVEPSAVPEQFTQPVSPVQPARPQVSLDTSVLPDLTHMAADPEPSGHPQQNAAPAQSVPDQIQQTSGSDIMDMVEDSTVMEDREELRIDIFSPAKGSADFQQVSRELGQRFPAYTAPRIVFDFAGVILLDARELDYLDTIEDFARSRRLVLTFVNVVPALMPYLRGRPALSNCVA